MHAPFRNARPADNLRLTLTRGIYAIVYMWGEPTWRRPESFVPATVKPCAAERILAEGPRRWRYSAAATRSFCAKRPRGWCGPSRFWPVCRLTFCRKAAGIRHRRSGKAFEWLPASCSTQTYASTSGGDGHRRSWNDFDS